MGKSIEEILKQMESERNQRINEEQSTLDEINNQRDISRKEWNKRMKMYENLSNTSTAPGAGGGGSISTPSITEATTILEYNTSQGASLVWNGVTFTLDTSLLNYSYTAIITTIPDTVGATMPSSPNLIGVTVGNSVTSIGSQAFLLCSGLTSVTFSPNSTLTSIGNKAFDSCSSLTTITIPNSVTSIGAYAFWACAALATITIPNSVTSIGDFAFRSCIALTSITIPNSVTSIGADSFHLSGLTTVTIANGQLVGISSPNPSQAFFGVTVETIPPTP
jgi:hypothetical protein